MHLVAQNPEPDITSGDAGRVALTFFFNLMEQYLHVEKKDEWIAYLRRRYLIYE